MTKKLTKADIESWLITNGRDIKIVGDYTGDGIKTTFECADGHQWDAVPGSIKRGSGCPTCSRKAKLTKADMESWLVTDGRGIKLVGEYTNTQTKTTFECVDGHQWMSQPNNIRQGGGCPVCASTKLTKADIESWLLQDGRGIKLVGEYIRALTKTTFECVDGHQWMSQPNNIKSGKGCPVCAGNIKLTKSDMESWLVADGRSIKIIGDYVNTQTKTTFECAQGHQFDAKPNSIRNGRGCPDCSGLIKLTTSEIESWLLEDGRGIKLVGEYMNNHTKTTFECAHGHQWSAQLTHIKGGSGCTVCSPGGGFDPVMPAWAYIFTRGSYLKYGITGNLNKRMTQHRRHGELDLVYTKHHENGQDALDWENSIKENHGGKYVTDALCPEGWTETLPITHLKILLEESK